MWRKREPRKWRQCGSQERRVVRKGDQTRVTLVRPRGKETEVLGTQMSVALRATVSVLAAEPS